MELVTQLVACCADSAQLVILFCYRMHGYRMHGSYTLF